VGLIKVNLHETPEGSFNPDPFHLEKKKRLLEEEGTWGWCLHDLHDTTQYAIMRFRKKGDTRVTR